MSRFCYESKKVSGDLREVVLKASEWNILENGEKDLVVVVLQGSDGKRDHCVTLLGKLIFDSNFEKALPLCCESLDICCLSDEEMALFDCVVEARLFPDYALCWNKRMKNKKLKK